MAAGGNAIGANRAPVFEFLNLNQRQIEILSDSGQLGVVESAAEVNISGAINRQLPRLESAGFIYQLRAHLFGILQRSD